MLLQKMSDQIFILLFSSFLFFFERFLTSFLVRCSFGLNFAKRLFNLQVFVRAADGCLPAWISIILLLFSRCISAASDYYPFSFLYSSL